MCVLCMCSSLCGHMCVYDGVYSVWMCEETSCYHQESSLMFFYLTETGFLPWTKSSQVWLASLASLLWGISISEFQALPWELQAGWHWHVFQSSKLWSSCFQNVRYFNHQSISPFFLWLLSIQINLFSFSPSFCLLLPLSLSFLCLPLLNV